MDKYKIYLDYDDFMSALKLAQKYPINDTKLVYKAFVFKNESEELSQIELTFIDTMFVDEIVIPKDKQNHE